MGSKNRNNCPNACPPVTKRSETKSKGSVEEAGEDARDAHRTAEGRPCLCHVWPILSGSFFLLKVQSLSRERVLALRPPLVSRHWAPLGSSRCEPRWPGDRPKGGSPGAQQKDRLRAERARDRRRDGHSLTWATVGDKIHGFRVACVLVAGTLGGRRSVHHTVPGSAALGEPRSRVWALGSSVPSRWTLVSCSPEMPPNVRECFSVPVRVALPHQPGSPSSQGFKDSHKLPSLAWHSRPSCLSLPVAGTRVLLKRQTPAPPPSRSPQRGQETTRPQAGRGLTGTQRGHQSQACSLQDPKRPPSAVQSRG